jgi:hypothetical protein
MPHSCKYDKPWGSIKRGRGPISRLDVQLVSHRTILLHRIKSNAGCELDMTDSGGVSVTASCDHGKRS